MILIGQDDEGDEYQSLGELVEERISKGWQPLGGSFTHKEKLCQAMVKYQDKDNSIQQA